MPDPRFRTSRGPFPLGTLAKLADASLANAKDGERMIVSAAVAAEAGAGTITFLLGAAHLDALAKGSPEACVTSAALTDRIPRGIACLEAEDPRRAWARILEALYPDPSPEPGVSERACVSKDSVLGKGCRVDPLAIVGSAAEIGEEAWIGSGAVIGDGVMIGARTWIGAQASVSHALVGEDVRIQAGARIGEPGFGIAASPSGHLKIPQVGRVLIGDRVEIGANTCIDRGSLGDTEIGEGTFIDNLCQIGHNVHIGRHVLIVSQTGLAGSVKVGDFAVLGGQAGVADHIRIGAGAQVGAQGGVVRDVDDGLSVSGTPAVPLQLYLRQATVLRKLVKKRAGTGERKT